MNVKFKKKKRVVPGAAAPRVRRDAGRRARRRRARRPALPFQAAKSSFSSMRVSHYCICLTAVVGQAYLSEWGLRKFKPCEKAYVSEAYISEGLVAFYRQSG